MSLRIPITDPACRRAASGLSWRHWAMLVLACVVMALVVAALLVGWNAAARASFIGAVVAEVLLSFSIVLPSEWQTLWAWDDGPDRWRLGRLRRS